MALIKAKTQINFEWNMWIGLQIAALQFIYIPIVIKVLNQAWVDSRYVHGFGLLLVMVGCLGASQLDTTWNQDQFYFWHAISCLGGLF